METTAVLFNGPRNVGLDSVTLRDPGRDDVVVLIDSSDISPDTERAIWEGRSPFAERARYPLVPGRACVGEVVSSGPNAVPRVGERVFVPGADCYQKAHSLFGGATELLVTPSDKVMQVDGGMGSEAVLMYLAATARHAVAGFAGDMPDLIVGHGPLGRVLARLVIAAGAPAPTVWESQPGRRKNAQGYEVIAPDADPQKNYRAVYVTSGDSSGLDQLVGSVIQGGEIVFVGCNDAELSMSIPQALRKEVRLRMSGDWTMADLRASGALVESGALSLERLISHSLPAVQAAHAYGVAFEQADCLKMVLDWSAAA